ASRYSKYFRDICTLTVEASCLVPTNTQTASTPNQNLLYLFARAKDGTLYWSIYNPEDTAGYDQTFWDIVPGIQHAKRIIGAVPYLPTDDQHQILLFGKISERGSNKLLLIIYDLLTQGWSGDAIELD